MSDLLQCHDTHHVDQLEQKRTSRCIFQILAPENPYEYGHLQVIMGYTVLCYRYAIHSLVRGRYCIYLF